MRFCRLFVVLGFTLASCRESTSPDLGSLVGEWADTPHVNQDGTTYQQFLTLRADRSYVMDFRTSSAGRAGLDELVAYSRAEGSFSVRNDSLFEHAIFIRTWDRSVNGGKETVTQVGDRRLQPGQPDTSGAHYEVSAGTLRLNYLSFPADAAVETEMTYFRVP